MRLKLDDSAKSVRGGRIGRKTVKEMVDAYRGRPGTTDRNLRFAHFSVEEVLDLLVDNKILAQYQLNTPLPGTEGFGLRIYIGNHFSTATCPTNNRNYKYLDTTILCNTIIRNSKAGEFNDMFIEGDTLLLPGANTNGEDDDTYLDQTYICPPTCQITCIADPNDPDVCLNDIGLNP